MNERFLAFAVLTSLLCTTATAAEPTAEEILSGAAPSGEYVKRVRCIVASRIDRTEVLSDRFILFHVGNDELWLARLKMRCTGLTPRSDLMFVKSSDRICEWDAVRTLNQEGLGEVDVGQACTLPEFESVTKEQVELLEREIKSARRGTGKSAPK
jgi:hypothetical protein